MRIINKYVSMHLKTNVLVKGLFLSLVVLLLNLCIACQPKTKNPTVKQTDEPSFQLPSIPSIYATPEDRRLFLLNHYWDGFNFKDHRLMNHAEITEQAFVNFITLLPDVSDSIANRSIDLCLDKAYRADSAMFEYFYDVSKRYFDDPNSPFRMEKYYIMVLNYLVAQPNLDESRKIRPRFELEMALKNQPQTLATDFAYVTRSGKKGTLSKIKANYTLLYFNNPDCDDCKNVKSILESEPLIQELLQTRVNKLPSLAILSMYTDADLSIWEKTTYPSSWIDGCDISQRVDKEKLYDLRAIPTLYLLDKDKRIIYKDVPINFILEALKQLKD